MLAIISKVQYGRNQTWMPLPQVADQVHAVRAGEGRGYRHDVTPHLLEAPEGLRSGRALGDDLDIRMLLADEPQAEPD